MGAWDGRAGVGARSLAPPSVQEGLLDREGSEGLVGGSSFVPGSWDALPTSYRWTGGEGAALWSRRGRAPPTLTPCEPGDPSSFPRGLRVRPQAESCLWDSQVTCGGAWPSAGFPGVGWSNLLETPQVIVAGTGVSSEGLPWSSWCPGGGKESQARALSPSSCSWGRHGTETLQGWPRATQQAGLGPALRLFGLSLFSLYTSRWFHLTGT